jgi:hypothetical protein
MRHQIVPNNRQHACIPAILNIECEPKVRFPQISRRWALIWQSDWRAYEHKAVRCWSMLIVCVLG